MIKSDFKDEKIKKYFKQLPLDTKETYLAYDKSVRIIAASTTHMVMDVANNFELGPLETYVLGQAYSAGAALSSLVKDNDKIAMKIECAGPIKGITIEAFSNGCVRGYMLENPIKLAKPLTSLDTSPLFGPGFLSITKTLEGSKAPFSGQIMLESGVISKDLANYFFTSEQTPTIIAIDLSFNDKGQVTGSGVIFIQALPGCKEETIKELEELSSKLKNFGDHIKQKKPINEYLAKYFNNLEYMSNEKISFYCPCTKEKTSKFLNGLKKEDKKDIMENGPFPLELNCANCNSTYSFSQEELIKILGENK